MHADDLLGSLRGGGDGGDGDGRGVGRQDGLGLAQAVKFCENFLLERENFGHCFDNKVAICTEASVRARRDASECCVSIVLGHALLAHEFSKRKLDGAESLRDVFVFDVDHHHIVASTSGHLSNAVSHLSCTNHTDVLNHALTFIQIHTHTVHEDAYSFGR